MDVSCGRIFARQPAFVRIARHTRPRARDTPGDVVDRAPRDRARHRARAVPAPPARRQVIRGGVAPPPITTTTRAATDGPSQDKPWPESAHEYDPSVVLNKTGTSVPCPSSPDIASRTPRTAHTSRAAATTSSTAHTLPLFFNTSTRLPRHRSGLPQGETRPKRGRGGQVHARHVRGPAVPRRLTPAPQGGRARLRLPPAPRLPSPRGRPLRAVSLFVCTYGQLE